MAGAGAIAGFLATIASTLLINVVINLVGNIAFDAPGTIVEMRTAARIAFALARDVQPVLLFVAVPAFVGVGIFWGAVYAACGADDRRLPRRVAGLVQRGRDVYCRRCRWWCRWCLVVMPMLGLGFLGMGPTGPVVTIGEVIRHAAYGVMLGLMYPISRRRPAPTPKADAPPRGVASAADRRWPIRNRPVPWKSRSPRANGVPFMTMAATTTEPTPNTGGERPAGKATAEREHSAQNTCFLAGGRTHGRPGRLRAVNVTASSGTCRRALPR